jgi:hypothetical protein
MDNRIEKIIVFGDSNCAGDELLQEDYMPEIEDMFSKYGATRHQKGYVDKVKNGNLRDLQRNVNSLIHKRNQEDHKKIRDAQFFHSFGGQLGSLANVEVVNYARGGNSNIGIYETVANCKVDINPNTLLLIGSTYLNRKTRLVKDHGTPDDKAWKHLLEWNTFLPGWSPKGREKDAETYMMFDIEWGDDNYFRFMAFIAQLKAMQFQLKDIPHYFLDVTGAYSHLFFEAPLPKSHTKQIKSELENILLPDSSLYNTDLEIKKRSALFGHCNRQVHKAYAQKLFDKFKKDNIL